jgi:hypothetical protein
MEKTGRTHHIFRPTAPASGRRGKDRAMTDRFTKAFTELTDNNPYVCESCDTTFGHPTIMQHGSDRDDTNRHDMSAEHGHGLGMRSPECIYNCDPMPFGD